MASPVDRLRDGHEEALEELSEFLAIESVSTDPDRADRVREAAEWVRDRLREAGIDARVVDTDGHPAVVGGVDVDPDRPTLLWYGHYDVQPEDPLDEWDSPPFEATVDGDKLVARGAVDDKGQVHLQLRALRALQATDGLPVNLRVLLEGEEEVGSPNLESVLLDHPELHDADAVVISDSLMFDEETPTITTGLRGLSYFEVTFRGSDDDLHSGLYGGAVVNPANALAEVLATLRTDDGRIDLPGFYDEVEPLTETERETIRDLPFDEEAYRRDVGAPELWGEEGYSVLERVGARPSLDVNGLTAGYQGEGAKTVIPAEASAKVSMRLVPDQDPGRVEKIFVQAIRERAPPQVEVEVDVMHGSRPWREDPADPFVQAGARALEEVFDADAVYHRIGGSIPILATFQDHLDAPVVLIGFGLPDANLHAPNENLDLETYRLGAEAAARFYQEAARIEP